MSTKKRVALIGANSFLCRSLEDWLWENGLHRAYEIFGLARSIEKCLHTGAISYSTSPEFTVDSLSGFIRETQPHWVISFVGIFRNHDFTQLMHVNVGIARTLLESIHQLKCPIEKIVLIGSAAEYGRPSNNPIKETDPLLPVSPYGLTKKFQSDLGGYYANNLQLPVVIARVFNLVGEGQSADLAIGSFSKKINDAEDSGTLSVGNVDVIRDYLEPCAAAEGIWTTMMHGIPGEAYNVCSGVPTTMRIVLQEMVDRSGKALTIASQGPSSIDISSVIGDPSKLRSLCRKVSA